MLVALFCFLTKTKNKHCEGHMCSQSSLEVKAKRVTGYHFGKSWQFEPLDKNQMLVVLNMHTVFSLSLNYTKKDKNQLIILDRFLFYSLFFLVCDLGCCWK